MITIGPQRMLRTAQCNCRLHTIFDGIMGNIKNIYQNIQLEDQLIVNTLNNALNSGKEMVQILETGSGIIKKVFSGLGAAVFIYDKKSENLVFMNPRIIAGSFEKVHTIIGYNPPATPIYLGSGHIFMDIIKKKKTTVFSTPGEVMSILSDFTAILFSQKLIKKKLTREVLKKIYDELGIHSFLITPLIYKDEIIGLLNVGTDKYFSDLDIKRIKTIAGQFTSIIKRKQAEEALKKSEEQYRLLIDNLPGVVWNSDKEGNTHFISDNVTAMYGYTPEEIYKQGTELWFKRIHEDDRDMVQEAYNALFQKDMPFNVEYRIKRKDGIWIWLHDRSFETYTRNDKSMAAGIIFDITEKKRLEYALCESENNLKKFINLITDSFFLFDADLNIIMINNKARKMIGKPEKEIIGKNVLDLVPDMKNEKRYKKYKQVVRTGKPFFIENYVPQTVFGDRHFFLRSFKIGSGLGIIATDITELKQVEEELRDRLYFEKMISDFSFNFVNLPVEKIDKELKNGLRFIGENFNIDTIYLWELSTDNNNYIVNCVWDKERSIDFPLTTSCDRLPYIKKCLLNGEIFKFSNILEVPEKAVNELAYFKQHNIQSFLVLPLSVSEKVIAGISFATVTSEFIWTDEIRQSLSIFGQIISNTLARKRAWAEKRKLEKEKQKQERILMRSQRLSSLGNLVSAITHEIRQPLHLIKIVSDTFLYLKDANKEEILDNIDLFKKMNQISEGVDRINNIIHNIQNLVKDPEKIVKSIHNINTLIMEVIDLYKQKIKNHGIALVLDLDNSIDKIMLSSIQFQQVLLNLINNAIDALDMQTNKDKKVIISTRQNFKNIILKIIDNGPGIDEPIKEKIFDPLFSTKSDNESLGLGLFIVNTIIESMGGSIEINSRIDKGTAFIIRLPV